MSAAKDNLDYELLTEHLGYPPVSLLDDIINTVNVLADRALDSVERLLLSIPPQNFGFNGSTTITEFALSQLQALRALSTSLRTILPDLSASPSSASPAGDDHTGEKKSWRCARTRVTVL